MSGEVPFLFSVDVEDPRLHVEDGERFEARVPALTETYLEFLRRHRAKATFFVVGEVARRHPRTIAAIAAEGHEIACHSDSHVPLERQGPAAFRDDLRRNLDALAAAGAARPTGYRAPCFSLTQRTAWAYAALAEQGFVYSSSVLPARSPLYGWPGFGTAPRLVDGVLELPMTLLSPRLLPLPMGGGVYFRALPMTLIAGAFRRRRRRREPVLGYFHPYDIDTAPERFTHPGFSRRSPYSWLLRANRSAVMPRLEGVLALGYSIRTYAEHAEAVRRDIDFAAEASRCAASLAGSPAGPSETAGASSGA